MNFLKKGPELKLSGIKVPGFLQDVYYDLKDRHLLPVAAVLIVAIVAIPIALSQKGSGDGEAAEIASPSAAQSSAANQAGQLVAKAAPGLRDYRRRLDHLAPHDPFRAKYADPEPTAESGGSPNEPAGSTGTETSSSSESFSGSESGGGEPPTTTTPHQELTYYSYAIDVRISGGGSGEGSEKATVRRNLPELTMLPSRETPAVVYMGATRDGKKAVMTVSSDVQAIFGDAKCALGSERCELLVMEEGLPETFVYGGAGRTYRIELLKIHLVESDKLNRAPLGKPKKHEGGNRAGLALGHGAGIRKQP
jgi:hypothetical protein